MKKIFIIFILIIILIPKSIFAEDIYNFELEGISIGDDLLELLNKDEVFQLVDLTKDNYSYLKEPNKYTEVYYQKDLKVYDYVSFFIKNPIQNKFLSKKNEEYTILSLRGGINFTNDLEGCLNARDELAKQITNMFQSAEKKTMTLKHPLDPSGRSIYHFLYFELQNGDNVELSCNDWEENFRNQNGYSEGLNLALINKEVGAWLGNYK